MTPQLYLAVTPCPPADALPAMVRELVAMLAPCEENQAYVYALSHGLARVAAQRLGALSLLLSLLEQADISPSDIVLHRDENGRPFALDGMDSRRFDFNLTHTDSVVGCVLWTGVGRVGMDIEHAPDADRVKKIADRYFSDGERSMMTDEDSSHAFLRIWTAKEALSKQDGLGNPTVFDATAVPAGYQLVHGRVSYGNAVICLCIPCEAAIPPVEGIDWI